MVSKPDYDPNTIASDWESVNGEGSTALYNRATQGSMPRAQCLRFLQH